MNSVLEDCASHANRDYNDNESYLEICTLGKKPLTVMAEATRNELQDASANNLQKFSFTHTTSNMGGKERRNYIS